jgi:hypothetical protein
MPVVVESNKENKFLEGDPWVVGWLMNISFLPTTNQGKRENDPQLISSIIPISTKWRRASRIGMNE